MQPGTAERSAQAQPLRLVWAAWALAALYLLRLGAVPLFDVDEGAFAQAAREMLASGDWGHTTLNGADRFDKPILVYWLQAAAMALLGVNEFAARLPSALCTLAAAWQAGQFLRARWDESCAALAMFIGAGALGLVAIGRAATADGLLNALLVLTALRLWQFAETGERKDLHWAYFWCGLGLLAKGPVAAVVPGGALFWWSIFSDRGRTAWRALASARGWLIALGVAAPWYLYALNRHGQAFIDGFFIQHNVQRFSGALEGHGGGLAYYLMVWPLLCLPWTPLLAALLIQARSLWRDPLSRFLLVWAAWVLVFFSLAGTKLPHYVLYGSAPLLWLMARLLHAAGRGWHLALWLILALCVIALGLSPWAAQHWAEVIAHPGYRALLAGAAPPPALPWAVAAGVALLAYGAWRARAAWALGLGAWASLLLVTSTVVPWWGQTLQGQVKAAGLLLRQRDQAATQWQLHQPSVGFYAQAQVPRRAPLNDEWALTRLSKGIQATDARVVWRQGDFVLLKATP